jgi:hypothetical protein
MRGPWQAQGALNVLFAACWLTALSPEGFRGWSADLAGAEDKPTLPACALRYGHLMAKHWLTVDLAQQSERGLFYRRGGEAAEQGTELEKLRPSQAAEEQKLAEARALYKTLLATNSAEGTARLSQWLEQIAAAESENEKAAIALLQSLGEQSIHGTFQAVPVSEEELAPAWDARKLIGADYRPRRIIFGSTGKAGDDRTSPLRFDFGSGIFSFYVPIAASNRLEVSQAILNHTDPVYAWMKRNHAGYHYWAGVYNNQNTYLAPWFLKDHKAEDDIWMKMADGKVLRGGEWGQVNIWNRHVRQYIQNYCETQARTLGSDPFLVCYDYTGEPHPWAAQPPGQPQYTGYNDSAITAFQDYLRTKFRTIGKLNTAWRTNYTGFAAIQPPPDPYVSPPAKASPRSYEFERFRCDSHARYWRLVYDAYRKHDVSKPIEANAGMFMSGWPVEGLDAYQLQKTGVADWVDMHMNNFWPNLPEQIYLYSLCRLTGKVPVQFEYIWTFPRTAPFDDANESDFRAICQASVWRNLVWGKKVLVFFDFYYDWPAYHNAFLDRDLGYSILRPSACAVPVTKRKALRFNEILMQTEVATPPIIVLEPTASVLNSPPLHPNQSFSYHTEVAGKEVHELLFPKNYPFLYVPEQAVLDGYALKQHKVIILPQAPYLPEQMSERLLRWVKQGGTLISLGVPGIWNPYGQDDLRIVKTVFGPSKVTDEEPGKWKWSWRLNRAGTNVVWRRRSGSGAALPLRGAMSSEVFSVQYSVFSAASGSEAGRDAGAPRTSGETVLAALATYGRGRVLVCTGPFDRPELKERFYEAIEAAIGQKPAGCKTNAFELVLREDKRGRRYLFVLNPHTRDVREDEVAVAGKFSHCVDLGVGSGVPVPVSVENAATRFRLRLDPGEGTVVSLSP